MIIGKVKFYTTIQKFVVSEIVFLFFFSKN